MPHGMGSKGKPAGTPASVPGLPQGPSSTAETNQLIQAVRAGQMSSDQLLQLLAMMAQSRGRGGGGMRRRGPTPEQQPTQPRRQRGNGSPMPRGGGGGSPLMRAMGA